MIMTTVVNTLENRKRMKILNLAFLCLKLYYISYNAICLSKGNQFFEFRVVKLPFIGIWTIIFLNSTRLLLDGLVCLDGIIHLKSVYSEKTK